jgi:hypothetical protein
LTVKKINEYTGSAYDVASENLEEQAKSLVSFLTSTIDNSVFKGIMKPGMVVSKVRNLEKLYTLIGEECPLSQENVNEDNYLDYAYFTKEAALNISKRYQKNFAKTKILEPQNKLDFIGFFSKLFGDNLERIIQYGSSVNGGGNDIDLMILLNRINRETYDVINGRREDVPSKKPVGIVLFPSDSITAYAECDGCSLSIAKEGRIVYGKALDFPALSDDAYVRKMYFKAGKNLTSLRGALGNKQMQEALVKSPDFLREMLKNEIWIRKALLEKEQGKYLSKEEVLQSEPVSIVDLGNSQSINDVRNVLYDANCRVKDRIEKYFSKSITNP